MHLLQPPTCLSKAPNTQTCTHHPSTPSAGYVLGPVLGKGGFCSVRKALHEVTGRAVAVKIIEKGRLKVSVLPGWLPFLPAWLPCCGGGDVLWGRVSRAGGGGQHD
jgi:hypothetical protein